MCVRYSCLIFVIVFSVLADAQAATAGGAVTSTATVLPTCRALTIAPLAFGDYQPAGVESVASTSFTVQCSASTPVSVSLDRGTTAGASIVARRLADGRGNTLSYQLYTSVGRSTVWGDGTAGSAVVVASGLGLASTMQFVVYGVIPASQSTAVPGLYTDSITITLTY